MAKDFILMILDSALINSEFGEHQIIVETLMRGSCTPSETRLFRGVCLGHISEILSILKVKETDYLLRKESQSFGEALDDSIRRAVINYFNKEIENKAEYYSMESIIGRIKMILKEIKQSLSSIIIDEQKKAMFLSNSMIYFININDEFHEFLENMESDVE